MDIERLVAPNPGPMTLAGTNTYLVDTDPAWLIDPGPEDAGHAEAVRRAAERRGGIGAVLLTHSHDDHSGCLALLGAEPARLADGETAGPLRAIATPGHAPDHLCFLGDGVCFAGDLILGEGSSFVPPREQGGSLAAYLDSLRRLATEELDLLCPGHGPYVTDPAAKIGEYIEHRLERERRLLDALGRGERSRADLLAEVWDDVPAEMRSVAAIVMRAHLEKLEDEGTLPDDLTE